jgi:amino acid adenylation domain-containing protein
MSGSERSRPAEWVFPASYGQERLWLASRLQPRSSVYNVVLQIPLPSDVDTATATAALAEVVGRHEALRTSLRAGAGALDGGRDGGLAQVVHRAVPVEVVHEDLRDLPPDRVERRYDELCLADALIPFVLDRPPLWRARLIRVRDDDWRLVVVAHHTICDATSFLNLRAELTELCRAMAAGRAPRLPDLAIQYADWAVWQREKQLTPARMEAGLAYWRARLAGISAVHALPTDRPRTATQDHTGAEVGFDIPAEVAARVTGLARRLRVTEFGVYVAAYAALLARLGGHPDVVLGVPVTGRDAPQTAPLIGMFVNTVPLRVDTGADPTFEALAGQVARDTVEALEHAEIPVQRVVEDLVPRRDPGVPPLYQIGFNLLPGTPLNGGFRTARDEIAIELSGRLGRLEYRTNLFDARTAQTMVDRYLRVLDAATQRPELRVSRLPLLAAEERALLVDVWSGAAARTPAATDATGVHELILAQAGRDPSAVAVLGPDGTLRYGELAVRARLLADRLRARGIGPERLVAIALPRSPDLVVAVLAVLIAGGAYLPLDPAQPAERLGFMLADSGATVLLSAGGDGHHPPGVCVLDVTGSAHPADVSEPSELPGPPAPIPAGPANLAYVIYTSGSAGRPKATAIEHRSLTNHVHWFVRHFALGPRDRSLVWFSPGFDAFGIQLFPVLAAGGAVVVAPESAGADAEALLSLCTGHGVTMVALVPTMLRLLTDSVALPSCTAMRHVICGGEQLPGELARAFTRRLPVPLHNVYGPTETTIHVSDHPYLPADHDDPVPIGRPHANARLYVLDDTGEPAPVGVTGHLHIGGIPVGRGYPGRPALTADRFVPDPFGPPGSRLYRTGDLARWTADGSLVFAGRLDAQIKLRGRRIEPAEVEAVLREQPGVLDAAVLLRVDGFGDPRLVAYVRTAGAAAAGHRPDGGTLRAALRRFLPDYMVPAAIVAVEDFPLTPNGKLDAAALPAPPGAPGRERPYVAPRTASEDLVATVWAEVLEAGRIGAEDDFFDLGGHSLLAARIAVRLSDVVGVEVPIHLFFSHQSVAAFAEAVEALLAADIERLSEDEAERMLTGGAECR